MAKSTTFDQFIRHLVMRRHLVAITLSSEEYGKEITRYCAGPPSPFALAASINASRICPIAMASWSSPSSPVKTRDGLGSS